MSLLPLFPHQNTQMFKASCMVKAIGRINDSLLIEIKAAKLRIENEKEMEEFGNMKIF